MTITVDHEPILAVRQEDSSATVRRSPLSLPTLDVVVVAVVTVGAVVVGPAAAAPSVAVAAGWILALHLHGRSAVLTAADPRAHRRTVVRAWMVVMTAASIVVSFADVEARTVVLSTFASGTGLLVAQEAWLVRARRSWREGDRPYDVVVVGRAGETAALADDLRHAAAPYRVALVIDSRTVLQDGELVAPPGAVAVLLATGGLVGDEIRLVASTVAGSGLPLRLAVDVETGPPAGPETDRVGRHALISIGRRPTAMGRIAKRAFDIVVSGMLLLTTVPLLAAIAIAVRVSSPGPVIFRQERVGRGGRPFQVLKFRSMVREAEQLVVDLRANGLTDVLFKMEVDPRVTRVGALLRRTSLDELPQLWNVLRGEMSLIGPRPALASEMAGWSPDLHRRLTVKPGISGLWQVARVDWSLDDYARLDLYYVDHWTFGLDLAIAGRTISVMLLTRSNR
jgi:exopolysaccharide biosynthesis polyprenyl glycosylphosphotransferase